MKNAKNTSLESVLKNANIRAKKTAFKKNIPVIISKNGKTVMIHPDKTEEIITRKKFKELTQ